MGGSVPSKLRPGLMTPPKLRKISEWFSNAEFVILRAVTLALFKASINLSIK